MHALETKAHKLAAALGRDWDDCGAYERQSLLEIASEIDEATAAPDSYQLLCASAGWRLITDSDQMHALCGDRDGIVHLATFEGRASHNDSVYASWLACYWEAIAVEPPDPGQGLDEGWLIVFSDSRGWEIQRDDETGRFSTDDDAFEHVTAQARGGSFYHLAALAFVGQLPAA